LVKFRDELNSGPQRKLPNDATSTSHQPNNRKERETKTVGPEESTDGRGRIIYSTQQTASFYLHALQLKKQMLPLQI
jgi:hypothetical protein